MYEGAEEGDGSVYVSGVRDFALKDIFECGQCFRWNLQEDGSYAGVAFGRAVNIFCRDEEAGNGSPRKTVVIENCTIDDFENIWKKYLDLDRDYGKIKGILSAEDYVMKKAVSYGEGIRILNQDEWETLISFILSQNRNIPLIKKSIEQICRSFGEEITDGRGNIRYSFPEPEVLAALEEKDLEECRLGYRTRYVLETSRAVAGNPERLREMTAASYDDALKYLTGLCGVGPKVANCILLFSMEKYESFPVDVWVRRLMAELYGADEKNLRQINEMAERLFGKYGGFAQQYLFFYARENKLGK